MTTKSLAQKYKFRIRNIHDGFLVPPTRTTKNVRRSRGYSSTEDRFDVIICRYGYLYVENNQLDFVLLAKSKRRFNSCMDQLRRIDGIVFKQEGDTESAGCVSIRFTDDVARVLGVWRRKSKK